MGTGLLVLVGTGDWLLASLIFVLGRIGYGGSIIFYDALLPHVARKEDRDWVSSRGYALGYLGGGILLAINVAMFLFIPDSVFENAGIRLSFLSVAIWWLLFSLPILRALTHAIDDSGITELQLSTRFDAAIEMIRRWQADFPETAQRFKTEIAQQARQTCETFIDQLEKHYADSYRLFEAVYSELTAGATFDPTIEHAPDVVYRDVASQLRDYGYSGVVVILDEFGRYLEGYASQAFGKEAALLQDFAETCNHSADDEQIHLILLTHKELQGYADALPQSYQQEWSRIEGRFRSIISPILP